MTNAALKNLWIVGGGGAALEVWAVCQSLGWQVAGFVTDSGRVGAPLARQRYLATSDFLASQDAGDAQVVLAVGYPPDRKRLASVFAAYSSPTLVHPTSVVGPAVQLGPGSIVMALSVLETHITIGQHALINVQCSVAHECTVGDFCNLGPGVHLAGDVRIGSCCDLGVGCVVRPGITLGDAMQVGAGAVVVDDFALSATLVGIPARPLQR